MAATSVPSQTRDTRLLNIDPRIIWHGLWSEFERSRIHILESYFAPLADTSANLRFDGEKLQQRMGDPYDSVNRQRGIDLNDFSYPRVAYHEKCDLIDIVARRCIYIAEFAHKHGLQPMPPGKELVNLDQEPMLSLDLRLFQTGVLKAADNFGYAKDVLVWMYGFDKRELEWLERNPRKEECAEQWSTLEQFHRLQTRLGRDICKDLVEQLRFTFYAVRDSQKPRPERAAQGGNVSRRNVDHLAISRRREFKIARIMADRIERNCRENSGQRTSMIVMRGTRGDWRSLSMENRYRLLGAATPGYPEHEWYHEMVTTYRDDLVAPQQQVPAWRYNVTHTYIQPNSGCGQPAQTVSGFIDNSRAPIRLRGQSAGERPLRYPPGLLPNVPGSWTVPGSAPGMETTAHRVATSGKPTVDARVWNRGFVDSPPRQAAPIQSLSGSRHVFLAYGQPNTNARTLSPGQWTYFKTTTEPILIPTATSDRNRTSIEDSIRRRCCGRPAWRERGERQAEPEAC